MTVRWRKSTYSGGVDDQHCVELGRLTPSAKIAVRDSRDPDGGRLVLSVTQFASLVERIKQWADG